MPTSNARASYMSLLIQSTPGVPSSTWPDHRAGAIMSSSKRWTSASGTAELPGRSPLPASALSPVRQSARRSVSRPEPGATTSPVAVSIARTLWPSSSTGNKSGKSKAPRPPSPLSSAPPPPPSPSVATLADHLVKDDSPRSLSRQRSCTEVPRFADADAEARKIGKQASGKGAGHAFGRSMRFLPSTRPAGVTLTPGRVAPSDLRRLGNMAVSLDAAADVASSGSECSDASRGSTTTPRTASKPRSPLLPRTGSVRLLGSSNTQWALSPGRRSGSPLKQAATTTTLATVPESKGKKSLISLGWGHIFHRRKHAAEDASIAAAATATLLSSPVPSSSRSSGGEAGHHVRMAHCRLLQWRFANANADAVRKRKTGSAELELMGTWASVSEMRGKVARKRVQLEKEKQKIKLDTVLYFQIKDLESWGQQLQTAHDSALASTVGCARAAVCRLPVTNGAKVSLAPLATILQQALELTLTAKTVTRSSSPMAEDTASLISKLVLVAREEQATLQECVELLRLVSALQVEEHSLRSHLVQSASRSAVAVK
ncbi:QWRF motif-containing protein 3 [Zea mays]|uniref:QWRF motif-containing protein 3 n=1 Tax=Zea mays TaxID=4577 RepID=A0A1D6KW65_MAIZE|nr:QWRF motif-containing protein 3 [Zea mays]ONM06720.1 QWRF motif-containing protein 3 [Zea mays]|eukprot:XP_008665011.1 QWRF motif-containing protein 3 [Zea mays]